MEGISPNDVLIPVYDHEEVIYITPPEFYARFCGRTGILLSQLNLESEA